MLRDGNTWPHVLNMRDNSHLDEKLYLMSYKWPEKFRPLLALYKRKSAVLSYYPAMLNEYARIELGVIDCNSIDKSEYVKLINRVFTRVYAYRVVDYSSSTMNTSEKLNEILNWFNRCIIEAIQETTVKVRTEKLIPENPIENVKEYMWYKMFSDWKPVETNGQIKYYVNGVGDYYSLYWNRVHHTYLCDKGYVKVDLQLDGHTYTHAVHRDVANAFIDNPNPDEFNQINHINGVKTCNCVSNLEWCNNQYNSKHGHDFGLIVAPRGEAHAHKYTEQQVTYACDLLMDPQNTYTAIGKLTGMEASAIYDLYRGKTWTDVTRNYDFPKHHPGVRSKHNS